MSRDGQVKGNDGRQAVKGVCQTDRSTLKPSSSASVKLNEWKIAVGQRIKVPSPDIFGGNWGGGELGMLGVRVRVMGAGGGYSFVACLGHLTIDHASLSRGSTVPTPNRDTSNIWALITLLSYTT